MQQRRRLIPAKKRPVIALVSALAVAASGVVGLQATNVINTDGEGIAPVTAAVDTESLAEGINVVIDDAAIAAQGGEGPRTVKEFHRDQTFSQFAVTWEGEKDIAAFVRAKRPDGSWSEWYDTEPMNFGNGSSSKRGTDLIYIEPTNTVQVAMSGVELIAETAKTEVNKAAKAADKAQKELQTNYGKIQPVAETTSADAVDVVFVDGGSSTLPENGINLTADTDGMPKVISRKGWGADESMRCQTPEYFDGVAGLVVHHTAGSNNYSEAQAPGIVRGIYQYHAQTLGWCDIGYQSLADKYGNLYEGRYGGLNKDVWGAHAGGFNENTWAVSMMGNYEAVAPSAPMLKAVGDILGWRAAVAHLNPTGSGVHTSEGTTYSKYAYGQQVTLPNIFAHRDVGTTTCPGTAGYASMGTIRSIAKKKYEEINSGKSRTDLASEATKVAEAVAPGASDTKAEEKKTQSPKAESTTTPKAAKTSDNAPAPKPAAERTASVNSTASAEDYLRSLSAMSPEQALNSLLGLALDLKEGNQPKNFDLATLGNVKIAEGLKLSDVPAIVEKLVKASDNDEIAKAWKNIQAQVGPVLGNPRSGTTKYTAKTGEDVTYALFDKGIIVSSPETGAQALWGMIGDAWAAQGFDAGPLGLPVNMEHRVEGGLIRVDFQHGYITFDPATGAVDIQTN
ncbi:N-acetylmuramoyl-L-alanine amidase [Corynebacterium pseudopelargi]|uniref:N-acetylmuramoyl-L-alanine amidase n=1 Tax=Corynebacterium pseudopelargi TaxID=2080757 RepID=A0A3G6IRU1_9CORY|nr:N-acetylmuramoyl-L-alanine amidase [Corynebacterium pseudopelargi]AZA08311.1 N-acetylmuramoyl-L-alanine amidase [Corynebacterium pseudopelargi]